VAHEQTNLEENKAIVRRIFDDGFNQRHLAVAAALYARNAVDDDIPARQTPGPAGMPLTSNKLDAMFPGVVANVEATIAEDDLVAARVTWHGAQPSAGP
jgi:hypothetical protein